MSFQHSNSRDIIKRTSTNPMAGVGVRAMRVSAEEPLLLGAPTSRLHSYRPAIKQAKEISSRRAHWEGLDWFRRRSIQLNMRTAAAYTKVTAWNAERRKNDQPFLYPRNTVGRLASTINTSTSRQADAHAKRSAWAGGGGDGYPCK